MSGEPKSSPRPWSLALGCLLVGGTALALSFVKVSSGFATKHDPGPWMMPRLLALILIGGGIALFFSRSQASPAPTSDEGVSPTESAPASGRQMIELLVGLIAYIALLPWIGFVPATIAFAGLFLWRMQVVWWRAALAGVVIAVVAHGLFAMLFKVPLPGGAWN